jgi:ATP-dependent protease Clp ATPase subunit
LIAAVKNICNECVERCERSVPDTERVQLPGHGQLHCSFCKKPGKPGDQWIGRSNAWLCRSCLDLCQEILLDSPVKISGSSGICSFCHASQLLEKDLAQGPGVAICLSCIKKLSTESLQEKPRNAETKNSRCSFCGKFASRSEKLISSAGASICNKCIAVCSEIIKRQN